MSNMFSIDYIFQVLHGSLGAFGARKKTVQINENPIPGLV